MNVVEEITVRQLGLTRYGDVLQDMRAFTHARAAEEIWLTEHEPVYTLGQGAAMRSVANGIPVVRSDRGGDITYHGPGQTMLYALIDLVRRGIKVKRYVWLLEQAVIDFLGCGERRPGAPGVYVEGAKIAALGIRVVRGRAYHGLSLNVDMDLSPFLAIDPCGYPGLRVTQMKELGFSKTTEQVGQGLSRILIEKLDA